MDIRHYALDDPPPVRSFEEPSIGPPSFILGAGQYKPPYTLSDDLLAPFPGCDAQYASVCAVHHAIRLVTQARIEACPALGTAGSARDAMLQNITDGAFQADATLGFGVFVLDSNGKIIADALKSDMVGEPFNGYRNTGMVAMPTLLAHIDWVVSWAGGFVPHYSTRLMEGDIDTLNGDAPEAVTAYFEPCPSGERLGVAFSRTPIPSVPTCPSATNDFCAMQNVRRLVGLGIVEGLNAYTSDEQSAIWYKITYGEEHSVGDYYTFVYLLSWWGYPGTDPFFNPSPQENTMSTNLAMGAGLGKTVTGCNVSCLLPDPEIRDGIAMDDWVSAMFGRSSWAGGSWEDYAWNTPSLGDHLKVGHMVGMVVNGTGISFGSGMVHQPAAAASAPGCATCSPSMSFPCAIYNSLRLASHAVTEYITPNGNWGRISNATWFGSMYPDAVDDGGLYADTFPWGFYIVAFSFEGVCVADGKTRSNVGKDFTEFFGDSSLHESFMRAASTGGSWLKYTASDGVAHLARVAKVAKGSNFYYLLSSFAMGTPTWTDDCSSEGFAFCSQQNSEGLAGRAAADILATDDATGLATVVTSILEQTGDYSTQVTGDFRIYVLDSELACFGGSGACPEWPSGWLETISTTSELTDGGWAELNSYQTFEVSKVFAMKITWLSSAEVAEKDLILVAFVLDQPTAPTCDSDGSCPENAACVDGHCHCDSDYLTNYSWEDTDCLPLPDATLQCVDVENQVCVNGVCSPCPGGYYCSAGEAVVCRAGFVCYEGESPQLCPAGTYGNQSQATDFSACIECPSGTYGDSEGSTECVSCAVGTTNADPGQSECDRCAIGTYQEEIGSTSCVSCPGLLTTMYQSAYSPKDCVCPAGTYEVLATGLCQSCPEGMDCSEDNTTESAIPPTSLSSAGVIAWELSYPMSSTGYMTLKPAPLAPYKCKEEKWCPGGGPGICADNRDAETVGCSHCLPEHYALDDGGCAPCTDTIFGFLMVPAAIFALFGLGIFSEMVNRNQAKQSSAATVIVITLGLMVTAIQTMSILSTLSVKWLEPVETFLDTLSIAALDWKIIKAECMFGSESVSNLAYRQGTAPLGAAYISVWVFFRCLYKGGFSWEEVKRKSLNSIGAIFQLFFVSIFISMLSPFICYEHPGNNGYSMSKDPAVLCNNKGDHGTMVVVSCLALIIVILPYLSMILYATARYKKAMQVPTKATRHLQMFRFLFFRYTPAAFWYGGVTLMRGILVCLVPVVCRDWPSMQIISMAGILLAFCSLQLSVRPWRGWWPNAVDAATNILMVLLVVCVAMTTDFAASHSMLGIMAAMIFVAVFISVLVVMGMSAYRHVRPSPYYHFFICHYKAEAGAQARYLQILITTYAERPCYLDSDNLSDVEILLNIVRCTCGQLVVYLTTQTLHQPWCAGEIAMAWQIHRRAIAIYHPSFVRPSATDLQVESISHYIHEANFRLVEYGITDEFVISAYRWLLFDLVGHQMPSDIVGRHQFVRTVHTILSMKCEWSKSEKCKPDTVLISTVPGDDEATAIAGIIHGLIESRVKSSLDKQVLVMADLDMNSTTEEVFNTINNAYAILLILVPGSLEATQQLQVVVDGMGAEVPCVPICTQSFRFPTCHFFDVELPYRFGDQAAEIGKRLKAFFAGESVPFSTHGSPQVLETQADRLVQRIPRRKIKSGKVQTSSSANQINLHDSEGTKSLNSQSQPSQTPFSYLHSHSHSTVSSGHSSPLRMQQRSSPSLPNVPSAPPPSLGVMQPVTTAVTDDANVHLISAGVSKLCGEIVC